MLYTDMRRRIEWAFRHCIPVGKKCSRSETLLLHGIPIRKLISFPKGRTAAVLHWLSQVLPSNLLGTQPQMNLQSCHRLYEKWEDWKFDMGLFLAEVDGKVCWTSILPYYYHHSRILISILPARNSMHEIKESIGSIYNNVSLANCEAL